jgi:uncharacterized membrane protein
MSLEDLAASLVKQKLQEHLVAAQALYKKSWHQAIGFFAGFLMFLLGFFLLFSLRGFDETVLLICAYASLAVALAFFCLFAGAYSHLASAKKEIAALTSALKE